MELCIQIPLCFHEIGKRDNQEDSLFPTIGNATEHQHIFLVCDGMGGHAHGEVASQTVAKTIGEELNSSTRNYSMQAMQQAFSEALLKAYQALNDMNKNDSSERKMGTTLTFLAICSDGCLIAHIGDSRVYQMRPGKGILFQTTDHSLVNQLIAIGEITPEEAKNSPLKNTITRAVMPHQERPPRPDFSYITQIEAGDVFLLCSDGVNEQVTNDELSEILAAHQLQPQERLAQLKALCAERETRDNHSCYFITIANVKQDNAKGKSEKKKGFWERLFG